MKNFDNAGRREYDALDGVAVEKNTFTRRIDGLGRIIIPKEIRGVLGIEAGDGLNLKIDGERIIITKIIDGSDV